GRCCQPSGLVPIITDHSCSRGARGRVYKRSAMANLQVNTVTKSYGSKKLFEDVTVNFTAGKRYGLTGPNGAGKSTFMKILAGDLDPDTGSVARPEKTS